MVALPLHTSHDLQPLDVSTFKPFKTNFRKERNLAMERNNHVELDKVTLVRWVNKNPKDLLTKKMKLGFRVIRIWPLNLATMVEKTSPNESVCCKPRPWRHSFFKFNINGRGGQHWKKGFYYVYITRHWFGNLEWDYHKWRWIVLFTFTMLLCIDAWQPYNPINLSHPNISSCQLIKLNYS